MQYKQIDGLRFFAVIAVIFQHVCPLPFWHDFPIGSFGVNLFFVISGFLITEILMREKIKETTTPALLKTFFTRRVLRIFPLYYLYILICLFFVPYETHEYMPWLLTYTMNIWIAFKNQLAFWYFTHLWSLGVEEQFYIVWPFLIISFPVKRLKVLFLLMIALSILYRAVNVFYLNNYYLFNETMLPTTLDCFGAGALLAYLKTFKSVQLNNAMRHKYLIVAGILLFILNNRFGTILMQQSLGKALNAFVAFYLVGVAATIRFNNLMKLLLENKVIMYFGRISYGMYIYHLLVMGLMGRYFTQFWEHFNMASFPATSATKMALEFIFISICTITVSMVSYEIFEKRFLALRKYFPYSKAI